MTFDPFEDRLARDIRNGLSSSLLQCLDHLDIEPARQAAAPFLARDLAPVYRAYIDARLRNYHRAIAIIHAGSIKEPHNLVLLIVCKASRPDAGKINSAFQLLPTTK